MLNSLVSRAAIKSRSRKVAVKRERNNLLDEVAELKRKLAEVEGERDTLRAGREAIGKGAADLTSKNDALRELNALLCKALENIANNGHAYDGATNADLAKRALKLYEDRAKHEKAQ